MQKILLIEDERLHRTTTAKILSDSGYKVITAEDILLSTIQKVLKKTYTNQEII